jgi:hypothetical protein
LPRLARRRTRRRGPIRLLRPALGYRSGALSDRTDQISGSSRARPLQDDTRLSAVSPPGAAHGECVFALGMVASIADKLMAMKMGRDGRTKKSAVTSSWSRRRSSMSSWRSLVWKLQTVGRPGRTVSPLAYDAGGLQGRRSPSTPPSEKRDNKRAQQSGTHRERPNWGLALLMRPTVAAPGAPFV